MSINITELSDFSELSELAESPSKPFDLNDCSSAGTQKCRLLCQYRTRLTSDQKLDLVFDLFRENY